MANVPRVAKDLHRLQTVKALDAKALHAMGVKRPVPVDLDGKLVLKIAALAAPVDVPIAVFPLAPAVPTVADQLVLAALAVPADAVLVDPAALADAVPVDPVALAVPVDIAVLVVLADLEALVRAPTEASLPQPILIVRAADLTVPVVLAQVLVAQAVLEFPVSPELPVSSSKSSPVRRPVPMARSRARARQAASARPKSRSKTRFSSRPSRTSTR